MSRLESYVEYIEDQYQIGSLNDQTNTIETRDIALDSAQWFEWVAGLKAFRFVGKQGNFTARQERIVGKDKKQKGESYWYAYRKFKGHQFKRYLGTNNKITLEHLEAIAYQIEEAIKQRLGIHGKLPNTSGSKQVPCKLLQSRIEEQEQVIAAQQLRIQELEAMVKKKAPPQTDTAPPEGFTYLSDFCTLHHVPYQAAADLFPRAIRGQWIIVQRRKQAMIGIRGKHDFYVQLHTRADYRTCDDCPHQNEPVV